MDFKDLLSHHGHKVDCVIYGPIEDPANVALECDKCHVVLFDLSPGDHYEKVLADDFTEEDKKYLDSGANNCPVCDSIELTGGPVEVDSGYAHQPMLCNKCNSEWEDVYRLTGIDDLKRGDNDDQS